MPELIFAMVVPLTLCGVALYGTARRVDVYGALVQGAGSGLRRWCALSLHWWG